MMELAPRRKLTGMRDLLWVVCTVLVCALFTAALLHYLSLRHQVYQRGYAIADLTRQHDALLEENRRLMVEAALQSSAERLEEEAVEHLGLRPTVPEQIVPGVELAGE